MQTTLSSKTEVVNLNKLHRAAMVAGTFRQTAYVYQLLATDSGTDKIKTLCLLNWKEIRAAGQRHLSAQKG